MFEPDEYSDKPFIWKESPLKKGFRRPVIVHRAILGSIERFMAILIEHCGGKWPFFVSPRQIIVIPVSEKITEYANSVNLYYHKLGFESELYKGDGQLNKKIRNS